MGSSRRTPGGGNGAWSRAAGGPKHRKGSRSGRAPEPGLGDPGTSVPCRVAAARRRPARGITARDPARRARCPAAVPARSDPIRSDGIIAPAAAGLSPRVTAGRRPCWPGRRRSCRGRVRAPGCAAPAPGRPTRRRSAGCRAPASRCQSRRDARARGPQVVGSPSRFAGALPPGRRAGGARSRRRGDASRIGATPGLTDRVRVARASQEDGARRLTRPLGRHDGSR
jgi:hypothetical protein